METTAHCSLFPSPVRAFFESEIVQSTPFKTAAVAIGCICLILGALAVSQILLPNSLPHTSFFNDLTRCQQISMTTALFAVGSASLCVGALAIGLKKKEEPVQSLLLPIEDSTVAQTHIEIDESNKTPLDEQTNEVDSLVARPEASRPLTLEDVKNFENQPIQWAARHSKSASPSVHTSRSFSIQETPIYLAALYDNYLGEDAALYLAENMPAAIEKELSSISEMTKENILFAINKICRDMDSKLQKKRAGASVAMILFVGDYLYVVNVGDTRLALHHSSDEKSSAGFISGHGAHPSIKQEILQKGQFVDYAERMQGKVGRLFGCNSLGQNNHLAQLEPEIRAIRLSDLNKRDCLILGCDGLWSVCTSNEAMRHAITRRGTTFAAKEVVDKASERNRPNKIRVGVLFL